mgnify:CR=1 FL=1
MERMELSDKGEKAGEGAFQGYAAKGEHLLRASAPAPGSPVRRAFVGLDPHAIKELKQMMLEMKRQGCAVVISTHMLDSVEELWDKT